MLNNLEAVHAVIWAAVIGIAFAVIYTNISRTALSNFICRLIDDGITSKSTALTLKELKLGKLHSRVVRSAIKSQNGLKRIITVVKSDDNFEKDEAEMLLNSKKSNDRYYINEDADFDDVKKKFRFEPLGASKIIGLLIIVILTAVVATKAVDLFNGHFSAKSKEEKTESSAEDSSKEEKKEEDVSPDSNVSDNKEETTDNEETDSSESESSSDSNVKPTIPGPVIPSGPSEKKELNQ